MVTAGRWGTIIADIRGLLRVTQWLSPAFPLGSYAYSSGLETAMADGRVTGPDSLHDWLGAVLQFGAGRMDAALVIHAMRGADVTDIACALAPSAERLEETVAQGTALATTLAAVEELQIQPAPLPVVFGQAAATLDLPEDLVAALYLQAMAANLVSAAVRFVPVGQTAGQKVLTNLHSVIETVASQACATVLDDLGSGTLWADMAAMGHETLPVRIFKT
ncbi:MAG: urease accessory UreF family protein [Pseudomonadota bacterium]